MSSKPRHLLTVGHSYVLKANRGLAAAIQNASNGTWAVTIAAPAYYQGNPRFGDVKPERLKIGADETVEVVPISVAFTNRVHFALYGPRLKALMASGFNAIHCWEEPFMLPGAQMALWAPRDAVLTYFSYQNINKTYPPPFNYLERKVMQRSDGWIAAATLVEKALQDRPGYRERPHRLIGPGIDPHRFKPDPAARAALRTSLGWHDNCAVIGYLGRFTESKGLPILMRTLDRIDRPWRALLCGSGSLEIEIRQWARRYGSRVHIATNVEHERVPEYLNAMDLLIAPSQTTPIWREQFGRMLIEAFACRLAVIASDSGEIPYVVGDAGKIVAERDELAYKLAIEQLLVDVDQRNDLATRGFERARRHYTWNAIGAKYVEFFDYLHRAKQTKPR